MPFVDECSNRNDILPFAEVILHESNGNVDTAELSNAAVAWSRGKKGTRQADPSS